MESVQNLQSDLHNHVIDLSKAGVFHGHPAARTVFDYCCQRTVANDSPARGLRRGCVMPNCTSPRVIAESTSLTIQATRRALRWLDANGLIIRGSGIEIRTFDEESETERQAWLKEHEVPHKEPEVPSKESEVPFQVVDLRKHRSYRS